MFRAGHRRGLWLLDLVGQEVSGSLGLVPLLTQRGFGSPPREASLVCPGYPASSTRERGHGTLVTVFLSLSNYAADLQGPSKSPLDS